MGQDDIKRLFKEVLEEHHTAFYIEAEKHYNHHKQMDICQASKPEWEKNHEFTTELRANGQLVKKWTLRTIFGIIAAATITVFSRGWNG